MAVESAGTKVRERQVVVQGERLSKSVDELKEVAKVLGECLGIVLGLERTETCDEAQTPQEALCVHADFLRSKVYRIDEVIGDLNDLINRLEI